MASTVRLATFDEVAQVKSMWIKLYEEQAAGGMMITLPADAFTHWVDSIKTIYDRFAWLFLAEKDGNIVGFTLGRTRSAPKYFGGDLIGFISDVFVDDSARGAGVGRQMMESVMKFYTDQGVKRIELQVIMSNIPAHELYKKLGWKDELIQMVWEPSKINAIP